VFVVNDAAVFHAKKSFNARQVLGIPGKDVLEPFDEVGEHERGEAEQKHGSGIPTPGHLLVAANAGGPVDKILDRAQEVIVAVENASHVDAQRAHTHEKHHEINKKLQPSIRSHFKISPDKAGHDQVAEQENGDEQNDPSFNIHGLPQLLARVDIEESHHEEGDSEDDHQEI